MKKFISWASALAIASSSMVAIPLSANAEVTGTLVSNSFNGYTNTVTYDKYVGNVGDVMVYGKTAGESINIDGISLVTSPRGDDTSYWKAETDDTGNTYLTTTVSRFATAGRGAVLSLDDTYTATSDSSIVVSFKFKMTAPVTEGYAPSFAIGSTVVSAAEYDTWYNAKLVITVDETELYINDSSVTTSTDKSVSSFNFSALDENGAQLPSGQEKKEAGYGDYMTVSLDDLVVFASSSADPATDEVPAAEDPVAEVVTPTPPPTSAPKADIVVPDGSTVIASADFDNQDLSSRVRVYPGPSAMSFVDGGFTVSAGTTSSTRSETYGEVKTYKYGENDTLSSQVLEMYDSGYASAARGPIVSMTNNVSTSSLGDGDSYYLTFQVKLTKKGTDEAKLYLVDTSGTYLGNDNQYKYVLATISTGEAAEDDVTNCIARVPENEFAVVVFYIDKEGTYGVMVNGEDAFEHTGSVEYTSTDKITPAQIPSMVINVVKSDTTATQTLAVVDDICVYTTGAYEPPAPTETPVPEYLPTVAHPTDVIASADFTDLTEGSRVYPATPAQSMVSGGVTVSAGASDSTRSETNATVTAYTDSNNVSTNVLKLTEGGYATAARGPIVKFTNDVTTANMDEDAILCETFSVKVDSGKLFLVDTSDADPEDDDATPYLNKDSEYMYVLATIAAGDAADDDADNMIARVEAGKWAVIKLEMFSDGSYSVYVDGKVAFDHEGFVSYNGSSDYKITPSQLPAIVTNIGKGGAAANGTVASINEIYAYETSGTYYTQYDATYDANGILTNLVITPFVTPTEVTTNTDTQKTFFWTQNMMPYVAAE